MLYNTLLVALTSAVFATATKTLSYAPPKPTPEPISQCDTGKVQCCNQAVLADNPLATTALGVVGVVLESVDVLVGLGCTPITVIGGGGASCTQQPVCCENNNFNGLINIGCTPISL